MTAAVPAYALLVVLALAAAGCVGYVSSRPGYVQIRGDFRTMAEVLARFGEPLRTAQEADGEAWYYRLSEPVAGQWPMREGRTVAYLGILPVWWSSRADENTRFVFRGEALVSVSVLKEEGGGFLCGVLLGERFVPICRNVKG